MAKKRILVIDDEAAFTRMLKLYLEGTRAYEVRIENSGAQGLSAALAFKPDLILLDIIMPDVDGTQVGAQIQADEDMRRIPIIFLTAVVSREEVRACEGFIGGQLFIAKPVSAKDVLKQIEHYVGQKAGA